MSRFAECLPFVLKVEGNFVDDPLDRGGATNKGITQREYSAWLRGKGRADANVRDISDADVEGVYQDDYWLKAQCDSFGEPLDLVIFDSSVQHGVSRAVKILQAALQIAVDGVLGAVTLAAAQADDPKVTAMDMLTERANFYARIVANAPSQKRFANGWANRLELVKTEAGL